MYRIVEIDDFAGEYGISGNADLGDVINTFTDKHQNNYMSNLLGAELYKLFLAELETVDPLPTRFEKIYNAFNEDVNQEVLNSDGIKKFVLGIVYFYYARNNKGRIDGAGNNVSRGQNSEIMYDNNFLIKNYNDSISTGRKIQAYICENSEDYPEYNGQILKFTYGF